MARISLISVCVLVIAVAAFSAANAYYPMQPGLAGPGMEGGVCPPSGCPTMAMPMQAPPPQPPMPARISKIKPQPAQFCAPPPCMPPTCGPVCMPVCKPPVKWY
ncbi:MAG: hypothetical protein V1792_02795 [Pseudomonadota bacterium]